MDLISHILFSFIFTKSLSIWCILGSVFPDLDRIYSYMKLKFFGHESRTWWHELPFLSVVIFVAFVSGFYLFALGIISHIFLDFVTGSTRPFYPFSKKIINFNLPLKIKILFGAIIWVIGLIYIRNTINFGIFFH